MKRHVLKQLSNRIGIDLGGTKIEGVLLDSAGDDQRVVLEITKIGSTLKAGWALI